jgi:hypothetical protein
MKLKSRSCCVRQSGGFLAEPRVRFQMLKAITNDSFVMNAIARVIFV